VLQGAMLTLNQTEEPTYTLDVSGKRLSFLVDMGATHSTIAVKELPGVEKSGTSIQVAGLGGGVQTLDTTTQLPVRCGPSQEKHAFLLTTTTPVNLLGRDLLCKLGCTIACTERGVFVDIPREKTHLAMMVLMAPHPVVYWWRLPRQPISDVLICLDAILAENQDMRVWLDNAQVTTRTYYCYEFGSLVHTHRQTAVPYSCYFEKCVFLVRAPYLCLMGFIHALRSYFDS